MSELIYRLYQPADEGKVIEFYNTAFPQAIDAAHWRWKYLSNPAGEGRVCLALQDDHVIALLCTLPTPTWLDGRQALTLQWTDIALAKEFRQGLGGIRVFLELRRRFIDDYLESGVADFGYGLPVPHFRTTSSKIFHYKRVGPAPQTVRLVNPAYLLRRGLAQRPGLQSRLRAAGRLLRWRPLPSGATKSASTPIQRLEGFDERFDRLWEDVSGSFTIAILRSARYLNWRYPASRYVTLAAVTTEMAYGFIVLRTLEMGGWQIGHIADFLARDEPTARALVSAAIQHLDRMGADLVRCWMMPHAPYYVAFQKHNFIPRPSSFDLMALAFKPEITPQFLLDPQNWYLTLGDSDGI